MVNDAEASFFDFTCIKMKIVIKGMKVSEEKRSKPSETEVVQENEPAKSDKEPPSKKTDFKIQMKAVVPYAEFLPLLIAM
jgi:hypothetical protein